MIKRHVYKIYIQIIDNNELIKEKENKKNKIQTLLPLNNIKSLYNEENIPINIPLINESIKKLFPNNISYIFPIYSKIYVEEKIYSNILQDALGIYTLCGILFKNKDDCIITYFQHHYLENIVMI